MSMAIKATYQLADSTVDRVRVAVQAGHASSMSDFVEQALREKLERLWRDSIRRQIAEAASDPLFQADVREVSEAYEVTLTDGLEGTDR